MPKYTLQACHILGDIAQYVLLLWHYQEILWHIHIYRQTGLTAPIVECLTSSELGAIIIKCIKLKF